MVRFSGRIPPELTPNALSRARQARGDVPFDLAVSNPTRCALPYPSGLLGGLGDDAGLLYEPEPTGLRTARDVVAAQYAQGGIDVDPRRVILTASTSEAYALLFKLLCDPGDRVAIPTPSYPLLHHLAALEGLRPVPYRLDALDGWQPDARSLDGFRAIVVVHPNNPTGSYLAPDRVEDLFEACDRCGAALIADEVFFDFRLDEHAAGASFAATTRVPTFTLGGLSKQIGLPQLKLSWIVAGGTADVSAQAVDRLSFIADQYLSVATPVQLALEELLDAGRAVHAAILERCRRNLAALSRAVAAAACGVTLYRPSGGWSAVLRFPSVVEEERLALDLLVQDGVAVHPGYFFDLVPDGHLVLSLLPEPAIFDEGLDRLLRRVAALG